MNRTNQKDRRGTFPGQFECGAVPRRSLNDSYFVERCLRDLRQKLLSKGVRSLPNVNVAKSILTVLEKVISGTHIPEALSHRRPARKEIALLNQSDRASAFLNQQFAQPIKKLRVRDVAGAGPPNSLGLSQRS